jgi:hypothetical protein
LKSFNKKCKSFLLESGEGVFWGHCKVSWARVWTP